MLCLVFIDSKKKSITALDFKFRRSMNFNLSVNFCFLNDQNALHNKISQKNLLINSFFLCHFLVLSLLFEAFHISFYFF